MKHILLFVLVGALSFQAEGQKDFYDVATIQEVRIQIAADNWKYLLDSLRYNGEELLRADVSINGKDHKAAGVRYRDGRSFTPNGNRNGLIVDLGGQTYQGQATLNLSSALRDPSLVREVLASEIARTYFNAPRANYAKVFINNQYYGLFVNVEPVDDAYLKRAYHNTTGNLIMAKANGGESAPEGCNGKSYGSLQYEKRFSCNEHNFEALKGNIGFVMDFSSALQTGAAKAATVLNTDATLWMLAFNNVLVNLNAYSGQYANNYYLFKPDGGQIEPILGELNLAFGSFKNDGINASDLHTPELIALSPDLHKDNTQRPLVSSLLADELNYKQYLSHIRTILAEWVLSGKLENRAKELQAFIAPALKDDKGQYYTPEEYAKSLTDVVGERSRVPGLLEFMTKRAAYLEGQDVYKLLPPVISEVGVEGREKFSSTNLNEFRIHAKVAGYPKKVYVYYRFNATDRFQMAEMANDGKSYDKKANDDYFGAAIQPAEGQTSIQYYILAENAKAANFSPSNYNFEQYTTTLSAVNK